MKFNKEKLTDPAAQYPKDVVVYDQDLKLLMKLCLE